MKIQQGTEQFELTFEGTILRIQKLNPVGNREMCAVIDTNIGQVALVAPMTQKRVITLITRALRDESQ